MTGQDEPVDYKAHFVGRLLADLPEGGRVLDLGCGDGRTFLGALTGRPDIAYTGVEPHHPSFAAAQQVLGHLPNAHLEQRFGEAFGDRGFDLVLSLSVLEHVKHLDAFLTRSVDAVAPGGRVVHRYDLGHALRPSSLGERLRVAAARRVPVIVPAARFTTYPDLGAICESLRAQGLTDLEVQQSQVPGLKQAMNALGPGDEALAAAVVELDEALWRRLGPGLDPRARDELFPSITVTGRRRVVGSDAVVGP